MVNGKTGLVNDLARALGYYQQTTNYRRASTLGNFTADRGRGN